MILFHVVVLLKFVSALKLNHRTNYECKCVTSYSLASTISFKLQGRKSDRITSYKYFKYNQDGTQMSVVNCKYRERSVP